MLIFEYNTFFNQSDHLVRIIRQEIRDSRVGKLYSCGRTKSSTAVNCIGVQVFQELKPAMQIKPFSVLPDGSNDVGFEEKFYNSSHVQRKTWKSYEPVCLYELFTETRCN